MLTKIDERIVKIRLVLTFTLFVFVGFLSLAVGARTVPFFEVWQAIAAFDQADPNHIVVSTLRVPRLVVGLFAGSALAVAGLICQTLLRNGLADPGILGINSGAAFMAVLGVWLLDYSAPFELGIATLIGAFIATAFIVLVARLGDGRPDTLRLVLVGAAITAIFGALTSAVLQFSQESVNVFRFWVVGSLASGDGSQAAQIIYLLPIYALGLGGAIFSLRGLSALQLGEELAISLGQSPTTIRLFSLFSAASLAGVATASVGPIGFLGLIVPHLSRFLVGSSLDYQFVAALLIGPTILLSADILGRVILPVGEIQAGIVMALIGGIFFVFLIKKMKIVIT
ncbi:MAG: hypothetical protein CMD92_02470 [Gammaproteobacteria bacterium]|nr:hypothetical protein [Gammaproteobacteria bacterium]|tara:strand:+ start:2434 stop:3456 length:1023 start_codon:yes stop_codon:yes gene_type:complete